MKKVLLYGILTSFLFFNITTVVQAKEITVVVQGQQLDLDVQPVIEKGRVLVPLRKIFEALGAEVTWEGRTKTVVAKKDATVISITVDAVNAKVNGKGKFLDAPARLYNGRVLVPLRFCSTAFGASVGWDSAASQALVYYREKVPINSLKITDMFKELSFTGLKYFPTADSNLWLVYGDTIAYYDSDQNTLNKLIVLGNITKAQCFNDGRLIVVVYNMEEDKKYIRIIDSQLNEKEVAVLDGKEALRTLISFSGEVLYYDDSYPNFVKNEIDLWKVSLDGKITRLTNTADLNETDPKWSPDGKKIAFHVLSNKLKNQNPCVYVMDSDGSNRKMVLDVPGYEGSISWAPDSNSIAVPCWVENGNSEVWIVSPDGKSAKKILSALNAQEVVWSPDSKYVAVELIEEFVVCSSDGTGIPLNFTGFKPVWSPDSSMLLYWYSGKIWLAKPASDQVSSIHKYGPAAWSTDSQFIYLYYGEKLYIIQWSI